MKVIQIGVGGFGRYWVQRLRDYPGIDLVAIVDVSDGALEDAATICELSAAQCFDNLETALNEVKADVLVCVTPPALHRAHTTMAMHAGLDVICEKPLATTPEDALSMAKTARETGRLFAVSQNYRYRPATWTMRRLVESGQIGELGQVCIDFYKGWYFGTTDFRRTMAHPLIADMAIHHFDLLRFVTGQEAVAVRGTSWNPPWSKNSGDTSANLTFELANGARFVYNASWCAQGDFSDWNGNWLLEGQTGSVHYRDEVLTYRHTPARYLAAETQIIHAEGPPVLEQSYVLADFMAARQNGRQPLTSVFDNVHSLAMVSAAIEAVETGQKVALEG